MARRGFVRHSTRTGRMGTNRPIALAEHAVRSGTTEARGLKIINTEVASVSARYAG